MSYSLAMVQHTTRLGKVLTSVAKRMRDDFDMSTVILHRGQAGMSRESIVRDFVAGQLPGHIEAVHGGEIMTAGGEISPECDVLIVDRNTPPLLDTDNYRIVYNECVYGVLEVKTKLDGRDLADACEKIRLIKAMPKSAYLSDMWSRSHSAYGKTYNYVPIAGMIFAFDSIDLYTLARQFRAWCADVSVDKRPDSIWVLGKGFIAWRNPDNGLIDEKPEPGAGMLIMQATEGQDILLALAMHLRLSFATAWMPPLKLGDYLGSDSLGTVLCAMPAPEVPWIHE